MLDSLDIALRLGVAMLAGGALGLNRDLHGKPTGVRTLGLVGLGAALAVIAVADSGSHDAASRVIQGVLTGIGFLGAGVILRPPTGSKVHGLTTAALTWVTAAVGVICGAGHWRAVGIALLLIFVLLFLGRPVERLARHLCGEEEPPLRGDPPGP